MSRTFRHPAHHTRMLTELPAPASEPGAPVRVWGSRDFLVALYSDEGRDRLTINRTTMDRTTGRWVDGITWDEIQDLKRQAGFGDRWAVEVYPPESEVVDAANMRHLWLLDTPPSVGWAQEVA